MTESPRLGVLLFVANRALEDRVLGALHAAGHTDITPAQLRILARLDPDGIRLTDLARRALVAKQTVTALVDKLEAGGWVQRQVDAADARARLVVPTARARQLAPLARAEEARVYAEWTAHLGERRMRQLREALGLLRDVCDPFAGG